VLVVGLFARREMSGKARSQYSLGDAAEYWESWKKAVPVGIVMGDTSASVTVVEFADLECPACRQFNGRVEDLKKKMGADLAIVFVHYPLRQHRFARKAARALECADLQGAAGRLLPVVFNHQDSIGLKTWRSFAEDASISDVGEFDACVEGTTPFRRIDDGPAMGDQVGVRGTPTVFVNGWRVGHDRLEEVVDSLRLGRTPYKKYERRELSE
jgi:protein-disulfide isomerase